MVKLLFLAGSARNDSYNKKLARLAYNIAKDRCDATFIDLKDFDMPIYDGDLEAASGLPDNVHKLKQLFVESQGFFIASPEYNSSIPPLLKNALDWISRKHDSNEADMIAFKGKVAAISATSPGGYGGLRGLVPLRMMLNNIGVFVTPAQLAIPFATKAFDEQGNFTANEQYARLESVIQQFIETAQKLHS